MLRQLPRSTPGWLMALSGFGLLVSGCGPAGPRREMATVSGTVTLNGEALDGGRVIFAHVEGPAAAADIQSDGTYSIEVAVGQTEVTIDHRGEPEQVPGVREGIMVGKSLVPEKYAQAATSGLSLDVKPGANEFNIEMTE